MFAVYTLPNFDQINYNVLESYLICQLIKETFDFVILSGQLCSMTGSLILHLLCHICNLLIQG